MSRITDVPPAVVLGRIVAVPEWTAHQRHLLPVAAGVVGALLGAGCGWFWQAVSDHVRQQCALENRDVTFCWLGGFLWEPAIVALAMIVVAAVTGFGLAMCEVRAVEAVAVWCSVLTFAAAWDFQNLPIDSSSKILVPAAILGGGLGAAVALVEAVTRWWQARA